MNRYFLAKLYALWVFVGIVVFCFTLYNEELFYAQCYDVVDSKLELKRSDDNVFGNITEGKTSSYECTTHDQCGNGWCLNDNNCTCKNGYMTTDKICDYRMNLKLTIFLLSLAYGGLGADWFVLARGNGCYICGGIGKLLSIGGCTIWWLVDFIRILTDTFPDGNNQPLYGNMIA